MVAIGSARRLAKGATEVSTAPRQTGMWHRQVADLRRALRRRLVRHRHSLLLHFPERLLKRSLEEKTLQLIAARLATRKGDLRIGMLAGEFWIDPDVARIVAERRHDPFAVGRGGSDERLIHYA